MKTAPAPELIGNYVLDSELGRGAFGVVYRAHHSEQPDSKVALKVIEGRGNLDRSMLEPALLAQLDHPCIVGIEDYFRAGDRLVLALEYVEGEDLKALLDRGETFSQNQVREFLTQMAGALSAAHSRQIVHRDIKPSNVLVVSEAGRLRFVLTDFGIGRQDEGIQERKNTGGTYLYMAPEQLRGRPTPQSDLWALGVVAYRLLTGKLPFPGPSLPELAQQILYGSPTPPSAICGEPVDPDLEAAILKCLDKSLQERATSADELLRMLGFHGRPEEVLSRIGPTKQRTDPADTLDRRMARGIRWRKILLLCLLAIYLLPSGLLVTAILIAGLWLFFKGQTADHWTSRKRVAIVIASLVLLTSTSILKYVFPFNEFALISSSWVKRITAQAAPEPAGGRGPQPDSTFMMVWLVFQWALIVIVGLMQLAGIIIPPIAAAIYVGLRRRQREKTLRDATLKSGTGSDEYLELLKNSLDYRFADVGFHLKYAEALVARGRHADAAVEARLILGQDPYNFAANLLLANAYFTLGLRTDCANVCDDYLKVSGYCFEFAELRDQCRGEAATR